MSISALYVMMSPLVFRVEASEKFSSVHILSSMKMTKLLESNTQSMTLQNNDHNRACAYVVNVSNTLLHGHLFKCLRNGGEPC